MIKTIKLADIEFNPKNSNVVPPALMKKLRRNIERTHLTPPLIVRPKDKDKIEPPWVMIDGEHRTIIMRELGWKEWSAHIWPISEQESDIALATLNTLRGSEDKQKRAALLAGLADSIPISELADMVPESSSDINALLRGEDVPVEEKKPEGDGESTSLKIKLLPGQMEIVQAALAHIKHANAFDGKYADGQAIEALCADYLAGAANLAP